MSTKTDSKNTPVTLNGGVLIIGSLLWDKNELRETWRNTHLLTESKIFVPAPIRYGRVSKERDCTFTMVLSDECNQKARQGKAVFVPFHNNPVNLEKLRVQAIELIKAEHKKTTLDFIRFNWGWGTLALAVNPNLIAETSEKHPQIKSLLEFWAKQYGQKFDPDDYKVGQETPAVNKRGILSFTWPVELQEFDFLIATATKPERLIYPIAKSIADRILANDHAEYFQENVANGITTFQDKEIQALLGGKENPAGTGL